MASKKYMIQPLTPPRQRKSSALSILAKYATSTGHPHEPKKRESGHPAPTLPFSPYSPSSYDISDYNHEHYKGTNEKQLLDSQHPHDLETDLKFYRDYCNKERVLSESQDGQGDKDDEEPDIDASEATSIPDNIDFAAWRRDMNSKLATNKRQIRTEKRRAERARKEVATTTLSTPPTQKSKGYTLFQLGKSKAKKEEPENSPEHRFMSMHGLITPKEDTKASRSLTHTTRGHKKSASESIVDLRLFQTVRTPSSIEEEEAIANISKTKSMSPRKGSPTPSVSKLSPRNLDPGKVSPRKGSPAKVSPRRSSPAQGSPRSSSPHASPRSYSPTRTSPRSYSPTPTPSEQHVPGTPREAFVGMQGVSSHGKRVPRNVVSIAIAT